MKNIKSISFLVCILLLMIPVSVFAYGKPIKVGAPFPDIKLPIPKDSSHQKYLGVSGEGIFRIQDVKAKVVIIQIYNSG